MKNRKLKDVYSFTEPDLAANQNGELTARQIKILHGARSENQMGAAVLFFVFLAGALLSAYQIFNYYRNPVGETPTLWIVLGVLLSALMIIIPIASRREVNQLDKEMAEGRVDHVAGFSTRSKRVVRSRYGNNTYYYVNIGSFNMTVNEDIYNAYLSDHCYRLYFLPASKRVISAEMIDQSELNVSPKVKSKVAPEPEAVSETEKSFLVYSLRGQGTYNAAIKWYVSEDQPPKVAWEAQGADALALHQQATQRLPNVEANVQKRGWEITNKKDEGTVSANATFRRVYTLERSRSEVE